MIITSVQKYKGDTFEICVDEKKIYLHRDIVVDYHIKAMTEISEELFEEILTASEKRRATERGLYLLDYRDYSYKELFKKLSENYDEDTCFYVVYKLTGMGLINDRRYAANLAQKYIEVKKFGPYRASAEMCRKGLSRELVNEALSKYEDDTIEILYEFVMKKYSRYLSDPDGIRKTKNALVRQGYSFDDINTVMKIIAESDYE